MAQTTQASNIEAQPTAMKVFDFLLGEWSGHASAARGPCTAYLDLIICSNQAHSS